MTRAKAKARRIAAKREKRKREAALREVAPTIGETPPRREPNGRAQRPSSALRAALVARARRAGIPLESGEDGKPRLTEALSRRLRQPWMGCEAGRAIEEAPEPQRLWDVIGEVRAVYARYWAAIGVPSPYPPCCHPAMPPTEDEWGAPPPKPLSERLEPAEEVRVATSAMMAMEGKLLVLPGAKGAILFDHPVRDRAAFRRLLEGMA